MVATLSYFNNVIPSEWKMVYIYIYTNVSSVYQMVLYSFQLLLDLNESLENYLISKLENTASWYLFKWYVIKAKLHKRRHIFCELAHFLWVIVVRFSTTRNSSIKHKRKRCDLFSSLIELKLYGMGLNRFIEQILSFSDKKAWLKLLYKTKHALNFSGTGVIKYSTQIKRQILRNFDPIQSKNEPENMAPGCKSHNLIKI